MTDRYRSNSQQRILNIMMFMFGHEAKGLAPSQISHGLQIRPADITHDLANLKYAGLAEQMPESNRWRLTSRIAQKAHAMLHGFSRARQQLDVDKNNYTLNPY